MTEDQKREIELLQKEKFATDRWNFGRSPKADIVRGDFFRCGQVEFHFSVSEHRIQEVKIIGDFFASKDIEELEAMFAGVPYDREGILAVLRNADLGSYLGDVTAEELADVIV